VPSDRTSVHFIETGPGLEKQPGLSRRLQEETMAIHKVIEVLSESENGWEDAAQRAVADAGKTVENIKSIWIKNFEAVVKDNKIVEYRINANITFEVKN
jgi:flavin-binding protein dodecin